MTRNTNKTLETYLPSFGGFYQTHWEQLLTDVEEMYTTMHAESERAQGGLSREDLAAIFSETRSASRLCNALARCFCERFDEEMSERLGFRLNLKFVKLKSPNEYNFTTDRIIATMPMRATKRLFSLSMRDQYERLADEISDCFTPYPGFVPYYSDKVSDWLAKPVQKWDKNELCVLLAAFVDTDIDEEVYQAVADYDACSAFEDSVNWKRFEEKAAALRHRKTKAFLQSFDFEGEAS
ncbi:hypothetical protein QY049_28865 [Bradyrhizobium sp. WYCCWR 13022]|uniref:hypothetical protein n=1 Tax=unclassified Bradyrhizobium TaxID=2631580 RepID=UPI00263B7246|nr:hypothetical protein [Bradyrhizobium sp. WYCCWR 13022]MDN4987178.1 hypothetical protein [Bradyrhizobium sp. WYCCWR 13022]